jgi:hypothetical protein
MRFTKHEAETIIGRRIKTNVDFSGVPKGTFGRVVRADDDGRGGYSVGIEWTMQRSRPLVDWFTKDEYKRFLEEIG